RVVEQETAAGNDEAAAEIVAQGDGDGGDVALRVDNGEMRGVRVLSHRADRLGDGDGRRDALRIDRGAPLRGAFVGEEVAHRHARERGIAEVLVAIERGTALRFGDELDRVR